MFKFTLLRSSPAESKVPTTSSKWISPLEAKDILKPWKKTLDNMYFDLKLDLLSSNTDKQEVVDNFKKKYDDFMKNLGENICSHDFPYEIIASESNQNLIITDGITLLITWLIEQEHDINQWLNGHKSYVASGLLLLLSLWRDPIASKQLEGQLRYVVTKFQTKAQASLAIKDNEVLKSLLNKVKKISKNNQKLLLSLPKFLQLTASHQQDSIIKNFNDELLAIVQIILPNTQSREFSFATFFDNHPIFLDGMAFKQKINPELLAILRSTTLFERLHKQLAPEVSDYKPTTPSYRSS